MQSLATQLCSTVPSPPKLHLPPVHNILAVGVHPGHMMRCNTQKLQNFSIKAQVKVRNSILEELKIFLSCILSVLLEYAVAYCLLWSVW